LLSKPERKKIIFQDVSSKSRQPTQECKSLKGNEHPPPPRVFKVPYTRKLNLLILYQKIRVVEKKLMHVHTCTQKKIPWLPIVWTIYQIW